MRLAETTFATYDGLTVAVDRILRSAEVHASEQCLVAGAQPVRIAQFASGRRVARAAASTLGYVIEAIGSGPGGDPLFPDALVGSISHTRRHAVAAVGLSTHYRAIGVDVDDDRPLEPAATGAIASPAEIAVVMRVVSGTAPLLGASITFSLKEAIFKCQFPALQLRDLDFRDVLLSAPDGVTLRARARRPDSRLSELLVAMQLQVLKIGGARVCLALVPR
ncbi:4'-phosphopantetheinyl transferase family protein [Ramlibacter sp.]|uniref:4'-phosphopantetheinyl transferase family protein n=1 Tax=Ramlibacter sp. TaxID=1917967 RepID=UPI0039C94942